MKRFFTEEGPGVSVLTLCGIRGVGKTSLAQKYASQCLKDVDRVIFIDAQTDEDFEKSAADFLDEKDDHRDMVGALFRMLKHTSRWLLILDDVYSVSPNASKLRQMHVESLWKKLQNLLTGKVIVTTSRSFHAVSFLRDWRLKECINLKGLDKASELKLVREILGNQHNLSPEDELGTMS
jgi:predicted AAA+ superfamily ATPase